MVLSESGGIDSAVLLAALKSLNFSVTEVYNIPYSERFSKEELLAKRIIDSFGFNLKAISKDKLNAKIIFSEALNGLGNVVGPQYFRFYFYYMDNNDTMTYDITG